ncbi:glycoside hydrolase family 3 C-terminal domain-containing protein [Breznakiella homolactica]|uniref:glycoside hydrolase family 3 C-terminal domain-containing protein n=1 Tax=Breznakiella homolactica TaxID=2798577 RepID=UPI001CBA6126|nr:glycoside hydrolase family 3 C-terminal domain-containing protein [Breznakiella homolactica]
MHNIQRFRTQAKQLVSEMTVEEMIPQLLHTAPAVERLGIPSYNWWNEGLHGAARSGTATVFPQAIGLAATFNSELLFKAGDITSTEQRAKYNTFSKMGDRGIYKGLTVWSPNINIFRDPRWGRGQETYGEDPFLTGQLAVAFIRGLQGDGPYLKTAAAVKHFVAHSGPEPLRHHFNAVVSPKDLYETYLPAFEFSIREGYVNGVMGAYSMINGEPACANGMMDSLIRGGWEFEGIYISDCWAIRDFHQGHHITKNPEESAAMALRYGCDLNCGCEYNSLEKAYRKKLVSADEIRRSCERIMTTRFQLGMFADDCPYDAVNYDQVDTDEHAEAAHEAARQSMVLLRNADSFLPLNREAISSIAVIGPNADSNTALWGNYHGTSSRYTTVLEGIRRVAGESVRIYYSQGSGLVKGNVERLAEENDRIAEAAACAELADVAVLCLGLDETVEGEMRDDGNGGFAGDKKDLRLPKAQRTLLEAVAAVKKPVIVVLLSGGPIDPEITGMENVKALIQAWYPGQTGGLALAEIIFGIYNPSGRLPITFPKAETVLPDFTDYSMKGRTYRYALEEPLYPFGFGLSYTQFAYGDIKAEKKKDGSVVVSCFVENTGERDGREVVQVYGKTADPDFPLHPCLFGFSSLFLKRGERRQVSVAVPARMFTCVDGNGSRSPCTVNGHSKPAAARETA